MRNRGGEYLETLSVVIDLPRFKCARAPRGFRNRSIGMFVDHFSSRARETRRKTRRRGCDGTRVAHYPWESNGRVQYNIETQARALFSYNTFLESRKHARVRRTNFET